MKFTQWITKRPIIHSRFSEFLNYRSSLARLIAIQHLPWKKIFKLWRKTIMIYAALTLFIMVSGFRSPCKICRIPIEKKRYIGNNYFINLPFKKEPLAAHWTVCVNAKTEVSILERLGYNHAWHKLHLLAIGLKVPNPRHLEHNKSWDFSG